MFQDMELAKNLTEYLSEQFTTLVKGDGKIISYTTAEEEYNSLRYGVGIRIHTNPAVLHLSGSDTLDFLHRVSTNDVKNLKPFHSAKTLFLSDKGRFIDRTLLLNLSTYFLLIGSQDNQIKLNSWVNKYIITEDLSVIPAGSRYLLLELNGKQVNSYLTLLAGSKAESIGENNVVSAECEGIPVLFFKWASGPLDSIFILVEKEVSEALLGHMIGNKSVFDLNLVGEEAYNRFRIEKGIPAFPGELNDTVNPHENGLTEDVCFTKGCYIGQEVIARLETYDKVQRKLSYFKIDTHDELNLPAAIYNSGDEEAGEITSVSADNGGMTALGFVRKKSIGNGSDLYTVNVSGGKIPVRLKE